MNQNEYKTLLRKSAVFRNFEPSLKQHVLNADGDEQTRYAEILLGAEDTISAATQDLRVRNEQVVLDAKVSVKQIEKDKARSAEKKSVREEKKTETQLLEQLKKI